MGEGKHLVLKGGGDGVVDDLEEAFVKAGGADLVYEVLAGGGVGAVEGCGYVV